MNHFRFPGFQTTNGSVAPCHTGSSKSGAGARARSMKVGRGCLRDADDPNTEMNARVTINVLASIDCLLNRHLLRVHLTKSTRVTSSIFLDFSNSLDWLVSHETFTERKTVSEH